MSRIGPRKLTCITVSTVAGVELARVTALRDPGVVHQDVDAAEGGERVGREAVDGGRVAEVGDQFVHGCTVCPARGGRRREPFTVTTADRQHRAPAGEFLGQSHPDARRRAGHQHPTSLVVSPHGRHRTTRAATGPLRRTLGSRTARSQADDQEAGCRSRDANSLRRSTCATSSVSASTPNPTRSRCRARPIG